MDSESGCAAVEEGTLEMAVVTLPQVAEGRLAFRKVWDDPLQVMVTLGHPLAESGNRLDLLSYPAILPEKGTETRRLIESSFHAAGVLFRTSVETNYLETIRMLVVAGLGWSVLPLTMRNDELLCLPTPGIDFHRQLGIITRKGATLSRAAQAFYGLLVP
jgi:DNA-binding transcriptional LysR family regulator